MAFTLPRSPLRRRVLALSIVAALLAAALPSPGGYALPAHAPKASAPFLLAGQPGSQKQPALGGDYLVYTDCSTGDCDIWAMSLADRKPFPISRGEAEEDQPATDGQRILWRDGRNSSGNDPDSLLTNFDIYGADLSGDRKPYPVSRAARVQNRPSVWGNLAVWADFRDARTQFDGEAGNIYSLNIPEGREKATANGRSAQVRPATNGQVVVWADYRNEPEPNGPNSDIYAYDLVGGRELAITTATGTQSDPAISGDKVVWADWRGDDGTADIYGYDLTTGREFRVTSAGGSQVQPAIWGNLVVWADYRHEPDRKAGTNSDIYGYDLTTGQEFAIHTGQGRQAAPRVWGNLVVWEDYSKGNREVDIWGATLSGATLQPPPPPPPYLPGSGSRTFPETGQTVTGIFLDYWNRNGALAQMGLPLSPVITETSELNGKVYTVQYFERALMEYHPENPPTSRVLLAQLGTFALRESYPAGVPVQSIPVGPGGRLFPETGKSVSGAFLEYWQTHGGLARQGYPISEPFTETNKLDGRPYLVQYFERAVLEYHPENSPPYNVLLSQLGRFRYEAKYRRP